MTTAPEAQKQEACGDSILPRAYPQKMTIYALLKFVVSSSLRFLRLKKYDLIVFSAKHLFYKRVDRDIWVG